MRAKLHPIETKRVCKAVGSIRQIDGRLFGDVENARDADRRVDREAADRFHSLSYLELEQEVQKIDRLSEIAQGVAKTITDRLRNATLISLGDRPNESIVDRLRALDDINIQIERASGREGVGQYVKVRGGAVSSKKKKQQ